LGIKSEEELATPVKYASHSTGQAGQAQITRINGRKKAPWRNGLRIPQGRQNTQNYPQITQINADYKRYPCRVVGGEVAEDLFERGLCLPR